MPDRRRVCAFTLIELLVVVAIIALLISILMPSLGAAREQAKKSKCLANLKQIALATQTYSMDERGLIVPIHQSMISDMQGGFADASGESGGRWLWRTAMWFAWGGRSTTEMFMTSGSSGPVFDDDSPFAARTRPLNRYIYPDGGLRAPRSGGQPIPTGPAYNLPLYRCPSDIGYPAIEFVDDSPIANAERSCYETLGNSYRASLNTLILADGARYRGAFSMGPWGQQLSDLSNPSRLVLLGEPLFFNVIGIDDFAIFDGENKLTILLRGWHRTQRYSNLAYADGSARWTRGEGAEPMPRDLVAPFFGGEHAYTSRGGRWQLDVYPASGARIAGPEPEQWGTLSPRDLSMWPFRGYANNLRP
jgi:prepilin-type N-terminal cleavage/methylation domain-containing protein